MNRKQLVAYFSMEIGLDEKIHTYSGGLGILAGDTLRAAADLRVPVVAISLLYRKGYFRQRLEHNGWQVEEPAPWPIDELLEEMPERVPVTIEQRTVWLRCWKYDVKGVGNYIVPVYFLDADLPENDVHDRALTDYLYGGDEVYRLSQEVLLGIGGVRMLRKLGFDLIHSFHLNEGHAALLTLELLDEEAKAAGRDALIEEDRLAVRRKCVFTTHTPVPAGHDKFSVDLAERIIQDRPDFFALRGVLEDGNTLNMTYLALNLSRYINGVAQKHGEVSRLMFAGYSINAITNGVHAATWTSEPFQELFDRHIPIWRRDNLCLRSALSIPRQEVWDAHMVAKRQLLDYVQRETRTTLDEHVLTIGFARRATQYKRGDLLFQDIEELRRIARHAGKIQVVYAGKAHPRDHGGKEVIKRIFEAKEQLAGDIEIVFLENYNMKQGALITSGVDIWLNTPEPPLEASGTSGMKATINGVPNFSVLDGWWLEGHVEGETGWAIGEHVQNHDRGNDARSLYEKLEKVILPTFYQNRESFIQIMLHSIAINGSYFNTHRMMLEYVLNAYFAR